MSTTADMVIDKDGDNEVTVNTTKVEKIITKKLTAITPPTSTANKATGPKATIIVDLQIIEFRLNVTGSIDEADRAALEAAFTAGGVFNVDWDGVEANYNLASKFIETKDKTEDDNRGVQFDLIRGVNFGS